MRLIRVGGAMAAAALIVGGVTGCGAAGVTNVRLQHAFGPTYQRLYELQQQKLGRADATAPDSAATCTRAGSTALTGAGAWLCTVHFPYPDGHIDPLTFDVEVQPIGCYTASGPPTVVGQQKLQTPAGPSVTNPLFAFDGCFDTS